MTNIQNFLLSASEYGIIIPGAALCIIPVTKYLKISAKKFLPFLGIALILISFILGTIDDTQENFNPNIFFVPLMAIMLIMYFIFVDVEKIKLLYIFLTSIAFMSFPGLINFLVESKINPYGHYYNDSCYGLITQWGLSLIMVIFCFIFARKPMQWLIENFDIHSVWRLVSIIPIIITASNIIMIPLDYSTMSVGRITKVSVFIISVIFILFCMFQIIFYFIAKTVVSKINIEKKLHIYEIQAEQYQAMKSYIENTKKLRHDFKHTANTAITLANEGKTAELVKYLNSYNKSLDSLNKQYIFCKHSAANAILSYYAEIAQQNNIKINWKTFIPEKLNIEDSDLCNIIGNLLENAIHGCMSIQAEKRYIKLSIDIENHNEIYIMVINSFNGIVNKQSNRYFSNKKNGSGIGLISVSITAEKYNGMARFHNSESEFYSEIMMKIS